MTVHDLIGLMGTKSTDPAISHLFETCGLGKPPKTVNANQRDKGFEDKQNGLKFGFKFNITNDRFYPPVSPKKDNYNFECHMHSVVLYSEGRKKTPDPKPAAFWEGFISPSGTHDDCLAFFGQEKSADSRPIFEKQVSDIVKVMVWMSEGGSRITDIELRLDEAREIFSQYDFNDSDKYNTVRQAYTLLVKWLFDNRLLILPEDACREPLNTDHAAILDFTGRYLKNHIWDTQLVDDPVVISFLYRIASSRTITMPDGEKINVYIKNLYIRTAGKAEQRQELYDNSTMDEVDALERSIWLDEAQCRSFLQTLSETFERFKQRVPEELF